MCVNDSVCFLMDGCVYHFRNKQFIYFSRFYILLELRATQFWDQQMDVQMVKGKFTCPRPFFMGITSEFFLVLFLNHRSKHSKLSGTAYEELYLLNKFKNRIPNFNNFQVYLKTWLETSAHMSSSNDKYDQYTNTWKDFHP